MSKPIIMMHYVMPNQLGGPNISVERICSSSLKLKYSFIPLVQDRIAGGRINFRLIRELSRKIKNARPDIVHISGLQSAGFHCICAAKLAQCKRIVVTIHGFSGSAIELSPIKRCVFNYIAEPLTLRLSDAVHGISEFVVNQPMVKRHAKGKARCIYNFPPSLPVSISSADIRRQLNIDKSDVVVVTASRITLDKGYYELSRAIRELNDIPNIKFLVVGDGTYFYRFVDDLREEISQRRVIMLGRRNDVQQIMMEGDMFVLPTLHENLGNVFLEASLAKKALIGTNVGGIPEIIINNLNGILVRAGDSHELAEAIRFLYNNPEVRNTYGLQAYNRLQSVFSADEITDKFDQLYQSLLAI